MVSSYAGYGETTSARSRFSNRQIANVVSFLLCVGHLPDVLVLSLVWKNEYKGGGHPAAIMYKSEVKNGQGAASSSSSTPTVIKDR